MNMKKKIAILTLSVLFALLSLSGCLDLLNEQRNKIYISTPVKVKYTLNYGYFLNISSIGSYEINYSCCLPKTLKGTVFARIFYDKDYDNWSIDSNNVVMWNIKNSKIDSYKLGVSAEIYVESFIVNDLTGEGALNISSIEQVYPDIFFKYTKSQSANNKTYVDPDNWEIKTVAENILKATRNENAFIVAKNIFKWLKENIKYEIHEEDTGVQPAYLTYKNRKGDCDDLSLLYISLCRSVGLPARLIKGYLILNENDSVKAILHAWVEVFVGGNIGLNGWIPIECTGEGRDVEDEIYQNFAIEDTRHLRTFVDYGNNDSLKLYILELYVRYEKGQIINIENFAIITGYQIVESKNLVVDVENNNRCYQKLI